LSAFSRFVATWSDLEEEEVVVTVASLVARSLVTTYTSDIATSYRLLDTTRAYVLAKLNECGEAETTAWRHAVYFLELFRRPDVVASITSETGGSASQAMHLGNIRDALLWCFSERGETQIGIALATASAPFFFKMSLLGECRRWIERAIALLDDATRGSASEVELQATLALALMFTQANAEQAGVASFDCSEDSITSTTEAAIIGMRPRLPNAVQ
jgi:predicted ATPase